MKINGRDISLDIDPKTPLLWAIRDELGMTGTKFGCGIGMCGACTVHIGGRDVTALDIVNKTNGRAIYGIDAKVDGMIHGADHW